MQTKPIDTDLFLLNCKGQGFRFIIPAGFDFAPLADESGNVCVLCLAEALGAEWAVGVQ